MNPQTLAIASLFALCFGGIAYVLLRALLSGADEYSGAYTDEMARQFEDVFLFIPPNRLKEIGWSAAGVMFLIGFFLTGRMTSIVGVAIGVVFGILFGILGCRGSAQREREQRGGKTEGAPRTGAGGERFHHDGPPF